MELETITVQDLIDELSAYPPDMPIVTTAEAGDYWRNTIANSLDSWHIDEGQITWSEYHRTWRVIKDPDEDDSSEVDRHDVLLLGKVSW